MSMAVLPRRTRGGGSGSFFSLPLRRGSFQKKKI
jgi:hypothetical protein